MATIGVPIQSNAMRAIHLAAIRFQFHFRDNASAARNILYVLAIQSCSMCQRFSTIRLGQPYPTSFIFRRRCRRRRHRWLCCHHCASIVFSITYYPNVYHRIYFVLNKPVYAVRCTLCGDECRQHYLRIFFFFFWFLPFIL